MARPPRRARSTTSATPEAPATLPAGAMQEFLFAGGTWATSWATLSYNPSELVGRQGLTVFDRMMRDDQIKAAMNFKADAALASGWELVSPPGEDDNWEVTAFVQRRLDAMVPGMHKTLRDIMSAMRYGYSISEKVFEVIEQGEDAGLVGIKSIKTKRPHDLRFNMDEFANVRAIISDAQGGQEFPRDKFVIYTYGDQLGQPYGESDLEAAYRPYLLLNNCYKWMGQYLERLGVPPWLALYNPNSYKDPSNLDRLKTLLTHMQAATAGVIPRNTPEDLELWSPPQPGNVQVLFVPALEHLKKDAARATLMPGYLGVTPDSMGSYARARVTFDVFLLHLAHVQQQLAAVMQEQVVKHIVRLNFETGDAFPIFRFLPLTEEDTQSIAGTWASLVDRDIVNTEPDDEDYLRSVLGFPRRGAQDGEGEGEDDAVKRIPFRYLEKLAKAFTINEVRTALGHEPVPWGDKPMEEKPQPVARAPGQPPGEGEDPSGEGDGAAGDGGGEGASGAGDDPADRAAAKAERDPADKGEEALAGRAPERPFEQDPQPPVVTPGDFVVTEEPGDTPPSEGPSEPALDQLERRVDLAGVPARLDQLEDDLTQRVAERLRKAVRTWLDGLNTNRLTSERAIKLVAPMPPLVKTAVVAGMRKAMGLGRADVRAEVGKREAQLATAKPPPNYEPKAAMKILTDKANFYVTGLGTKMTEIVRQEILFGLQNGLPFTETRNRTMDALAPYIGTVDADPKALRPDRLLTTVRTNVTAAYNSGRLLEARQLGAVGIVKGMRYSAVIDDATTDICKHLHRKTFRIDDPNLDVFTPPNHYRCRSILLPVTLNIDVPAYITPEEVGTAKVLAPGNFGGSYTDTKSAADKAAATKAKLAKAQQTKAANAAAAAAKAEAEAQAAAAAAKAAEEAAAAAKAAAEAEAAAKAAADAAAAKKAAAVAKGQATKAANKAAKAEAEAAAARAAAAKVPPVVAPAGKGTGLVNLTADELAAIKRKGVNGHSLLIDGDQLEDQAVLVWQFQRGGKTWTAMQTKLRGEVRDKLTATTTSGVQGEAGVLALGDTTKLKTELNHLNGLKTSLGDGLKPQLTPTQRANWEVVGMQLKDDIATAERMLAKAKKEGVDHLVDDAAWEWVQAAQQVTKNIDEAVKSGTNTPLLGIWKGYLDTLDQYAGRRFVMPAGKVAGSTTEWVSADTGGFKIASFDRGVAVETDRTNSGFGRWYRHTSQDGVVSRYLPAHSGSYGTDSAFAMRDTLRMEVEGDDLDAVDRLLGQLQGYGVNVRRTTELDREELYLTKILYYHHKYSGEFRNDIGAVEGVADPAARVAELRERASKLLKVKDVTKMDGYNPEGVEVDSGGHSTLHQLPFKATDKWDEFRDAYRLTHDNTGSNGGMADLVRNVLNGGGQFAPTIDKIRRGVSISGMSPTSDMESGGAAYFFTRVAEKDSAVRNGRKRFVFKADAMRRLDAIAYKSDMYGRTTGDTVTSSRRRTIKEWESMSNNGSNEVIFRGSFDLVENIDAIIVSSQDEAAAVVKSFADFGITTLPDGRSVASIVKVSGRGY